VESEDLGPRIKRIRESAGFSQKQFADQIGLANQSHVSKLELQQVEPSRTVLIAMSKVCGVSTDYILTGKDFQRKGIDLNKSLVASYPEIKIPSMKSLLKSFDHTLNGIRTSTKSMVDVNNFEITRIKRGNKANIINRVVLLK